VITIARMKMAKTRPITCKMRRNLTYYYLLIERHMWALHWYQNYQHGRAISGCGAKGRDAHLSADMLLQPILQLCVLRFLAIYMHDRMLLKQYSIAVCSRELNGDGDSGKTAGLETK